PRAAQRLQRAGGDRTRDARRRLARRRAGGARGLRAAQHADAGGAPAQRHHRDQRCVQRQPGVDGGGPAHAGRQRGVAAAGGARRDARAGCGDGAGARGARARRGGLRARSARGARSARHPGARRRRRRGHAGRAHRPGARPRGRGCGSARLLPQRRPPAAEGLARREPRVRADAPRKRGPRVMLYALLYGLRGEWAPLHVFKYITFRTLVAGLATLTLSLLLGPLVIRKLAALQIGQSIREDGPSTHQKKRGTPTMGGVLILFTLALATLLLADLSEPYVWIAVAVTLAHGLIGFVDDWAKVRKRNSKGVPGRLRLASELGVGAIAAALIYAFSEHGGHVTMPFLKNVRPDLGLLYIPFGALVIA